jgi:hypothetical protein
MQDDATRAALAALSDIPRYEERLTSRAVGIGLMAWGLAVPGIFLTYNLAGIAWGGSPWFAVLWVPWVVGALALGAAVWHTQAVSLRREPETRKGLLVSLAYTAGFFLLMGGVYLLLHRVADADWDANATMMLVTGLFAVAVGAMHLRLRACGPPTLAAGALLCLAAVAVALSGLPETATAFIGAAASGLCWFLPGLLGVVKG